MPSTIEKVAAESGVSRERIKEARKVKKLGAPEVIQAVENGTVAVSAAAPNDVLAN